jgi:UDP-GlcNAc:undecaprenyl-phosphate GlcNAc-1-phosphate transferase
MKNIQTETIVLLTLSFVIIFIIDQFKYKISKITKLIDRPDSIRKFHSKAVPLLGGIMIFSSFLLINLYLIFFQDLSKTSLIIFLSCTSCLILGLMDDIKRISYKYKFLILTIIFYLSISLDTNLQINKIYFSTFQKEYYLHYLSIPFTVLCLLLLTNAINLIDGMDGLCILISTIFIMWIINVFHNVEPLYVVIITSLFYILYLNLKQNIFLGDSGTLFLGCLIGLNIILNYNLEVSKNYNAVENIFITLMLPGLDMLRVFAVRIVNKKNPFSPDRMHLHHLLIAQGLNKTKILIIFILLILLPIFINFFTNINLIYTILFYILFYILLILKLKKPIS